LSSFESWAEKLTILHTMMCTVILILSADDREIQIWAVWREELH
jgi:hypothetical protein